MEGAMSRQKWRHRENVLRRWVHLLVLPWKHVLSENLGEGSLFGRCRWHKE